MKRTIQLIIVYCLLTIAACYAVFEPIPIEVKPVLVKTAKQWDLTKAYYQKVEMPDGTRQELKSWKPLIDKQWLELAEKVYVKPEPLPEVCPACGRPL